MLKICNLSKTYSGSSVKALDDLSLTIEKGEIFGFLGPNGAGKSTAIKCITGILAYNDGSIFIDGVDLNKYSQALDAVGISVLDQNGQLKEMDAILSEMGEKWQTLSNAQQTALAQTVAGVR